ncbi:MAG: GMC family oxidoreductase, partial [Nitrospirae bacterium]|nr:GMC family oxidoreductase [Nitrospirota bacterium]
MIIDLNKAQSDPFQNKVFDICICGAGVAGITLATNLSKKLNIALLEAGGFDYSDESQDVYKGSVIGREYYPLEETRMRYFGGTSNVWSGWCRPLDPHDFEPKRYVEYSGWPITRNDLEPYLEKAKVILDIPEVNDTRDQFNHSLSRSADLKEIKFWFSRPTRFGDKYRNEIENAENITCCLNANLTDIVLSENLSRVKKIKVRNYGGKSYMLNTRIFILATGGIENARIMLNCNKQIKEGLGNSAGLVGRFFAEHPHYKIGEFIIEDRFRKYRYELASTYLSPSESFMKQEKILNFGLRVFGNEELYSDSFKDKVKSILCGWSPDLAKTIFSSKCKNIDLSKDGIVGIASEQAPNLSSRILLSSEIDRFGMRRAALDWRLSE